MRAWMWLGGLILVFSTPLAATSEHSATGSFEVYCDGLGLFLENAGQPPALRELVLFVNLGFPHPDVLPEEEWSQALVYRKGCALDGKCEVIATGRVWLNAGAAPNAKLVFGKYQIQLNGQHLEDQFVVKRRSNKHSRRVCM